MKSHKCLPCETEYGRQLKGGELQVYDFCDTCKNLMTSDFARQIDLHLPALPLESYTAELPRCCMCRTVSGTQQEGDEPQTLNFCEHCKSLMSNDFRGQIDLSLPAQPLNIHRREVPNRFRFRTEEA